MTIQPQYIIWPLVGIILIIAALVLILGQIAKKNREFAKYESDSKRIEADFQAWDAKRQKDKDTFSAEQKLKDPAFRDYFDEYEYERQNPRPERAPKQPDDLDERPWFITGIVFGFAAVIATIVNIVILAPYDAKYYTYEPVSGTVSQTVNFTQTTDSKYVYTNYVLEVDTVKGPILTDDDRAIALKVGQKVNLTCHWSFVPFGSPKHECIIN